jgi:plastocyanin|tara:strand:+ start:85004 stop:85504 length:501 start_codon:yes stop_codon:yes gene_type:complete
MVSFVFVLFLCPMLLQGDLIPEVQEEEPQAIIITVDSTNLRFSPSSVTVVEGDTVRFFWSGQALPHNAVESNEIFDSGEPQRDVDYSFTFEIGMNGTYDFVCEPHAAFGMVGQIIVEPAPPVTEENTTNESAINSTMMDEGSLPFLSTALTFTAIAASVVAVRRRH